MTHDAATIAAINRRIAEFDGYTDIEADPRLPGIWWGRKEPEASLERLPRYWHSADAVLPVVERLCRERRCEFSATFEDDDRWCVMFKDNSATLRLDKSLPAAACLAVVAVLDGSESA